MTPDQYDRAIAREVILGRQAVTAHARDARRDLGLPVLAPVCVRPLTHLEIAVRNELTLNGIRATGAAVRRAFEAFGRAWGATS